MNEKAEHSEERRAAIREMVASTPIYSQTDLQRLLERRGFAVTQSSVSRDLAELRAFKLGGRYVMGDALATTASAPALTEIVDVIDVRPAGPNLLV
ncbi:MAG: hypothetical protein AAB426_11860, partial [Myxococcota bacterium]